MTATKIASDTIIMRSIPDHYRGRAFAVYDIGYNGAFVVAALVATALRPFVSDLGIILLAGVLYLAVGGLLGLRRRRLPRDVEVRTYAGGRADEEPREVLLDGVPVAVEETERAWSERRGVESLRCFRLRLVDGRRIQVSLGAMWRLDRELAPATGPHER
jgi:MFS family permease